MSPLDGPHSGDTGPPGPRPARRRAPVPLDGQRHLRHYRLTLRRTSRAQEPFPSPPDDHDCAARADCARPCAPVSPCSPAPARGSALTLAPHPPTAGAPRTPPAAAEDFQQVTLAKGAAETGEPMSLAVLPDRSRAAHLARRRRCGMTDAAGNTQRRRRASPSTRTTRKASKASASTRTSAQNRFVYLYYAPPLNTPAGDAPDDGHRRRLRALRRRQPALPLRPERRTARSTTPARRRSSTVPADPRHVLPRRRRHRLRRGRATSTCPPATTPTRSHSDGYTPDRRTRRPQPRVRRPAHLGQHQRPARQDPAHQGQRRRRATPSPTATSSRPGTDKTRPEIYAMGFRNPFRISVDKTTGIVYVGDYGPDAGAADPTRGPAGQVEFARITEPGQLRLAVLHRRQRRRTSTTTSRPGRPGRPSTAPAPKNDSPHNTGLTDLPPAQPAWIPYDGALRAGVRRPAPSPRWAARSTATTPDLDSAGEVPRGVRRGLLRR